jgi:hypothetical protein
MWKWTYGTNSNYDMCKCIASLAVVITILKPLTFNFNIRNNEMALKPMYNKAV